MPAPSLQPSRSYLPPPPSTTASASSVRAATPEAKTAREEPPLEVAVRLVELMGVVGVLMAAMVRMAVMASSSIGGDG